MDSGILRAFSVRGFGIPEEIVDAIHQRYQAELETRLLIAHEAGMRLAVRPVDLSQVGFVHRLPDQQDISRMSWEFVMLAPGEKPPLPGPWTIYEFHGDLPVGRSA